MKMTNKQAEDLRGKDEIRAILARWREIEWIHTNDKYDSNDAILARLDRVVEKILNVKVHGVK